MITGKFKIFSSGAESVLTCEFKCESIEKKATVIQYDKDECREELSATLESQYLPGTYSDIDEGNVCCCIKA